MTAFAKPLAALLLALGLMGCASESYPVSGDQCGPEDPVQTLDDIDCAPVVGGGM